jgi:hypothetical protein
MEETTLCDYTLFNRIRLKYQKQKELESLCNESIRLVEHAEDEMVDFFKFSNGIVNDTKTTKAGLHSLHTPFKKGLHSKRGLKTGTLKSCMTSEKYMITPKRSVVFKFDDADMKGPIMEHTEEDDTICKTEPTKGIGGGSHNNVARSSRNNATVILPPIMNRITNSIKVIKNRYGEHSSQKNLSAIRELMTDEFRETPLSPIKATQKYKSKTKGVTQKIAKKTDSSLSQSEVAISEPSQGIPTPQVSHFIAFTEPSQASEKSKKLIEDLHKVPVGNTKKRFSRIYDEFNFIWKNNLQLATNIEKSHDDYMQVLYQIYNREQIEQNKMFDDVDREKLFVMEEKKSKDLFGSKLDKHHVLKEYNLINILRDELAVDVMRKYITPVVKVSDSKEPRNKNHKKVIKILEAMQIVKNK